MLEETIQNEHGAVNNIIRFLIKPCLFPFVEDRVGKQRDGQYLNSDTFTNILRNTETESVL